MTYQRADGNKRSWVWDPPAIFQATRFTLSGVAATAKRIIGTDGGQWNNARLIVAAPTTPDWLDVEFQIWAKVGAANVQLASNTLDGATPPAVTSGGTVSAVVAEVFGFPADSFFVRAVQPDGTERTGAELSLLVWGTETACCPAGGGSIFKPVTVTNLNAGVGFITAGYTGASLLRMYHGINTSGATVYPMVFDALAAPANGSVPLFTPPEVAAGEQWSLTVPDAGLQFQTGILVVASSTNGTLTIVGAGSPLLASLHHHPN